MKRADIIVITKCPQHISEDAKKDVINKIKPHINQKVYFSYIKEYKCIDMSSHKQIELHKKEKHTLITGVANPNPLLNFLNADGPIFGSSRRCAMQVPVNRPIINKKT